MNINVAVQTDNGLFVPVIKVGLLSVYLQSELFMLIVTKRVHITGNHAVKFTGRGQERFVQDFRRG